MPLILISGIPCSGKTTLAEKLKEFFVQQEKTVIVVSEYEKMIEAGFTKKTLYADSNKEKHIRDLLKSEIIKVLSSKNVVIFDALNYIKGYRYELYCATKANKSTQCCVYPIVNHEHAWNFNTNREDSSEKYDRETFDQLLMRFEEPNGKNRWDAPLFSVIENESLEFDKIFASLFNKKPPKPNMATQNPPRSDANFLFKLDQITKTITDEVLNAKGNSDNGMVNIKCFNLDVTLSVTNFSKEDIITLRREFILICKMNTPVVELIPDLYTKYLSSKMNSG